MNLLIWKKSMDLTDLVFQYIKGLPVTEKYNLIDQMNRSSCSIPTNIAEGSGKRTKKHFEEFLATALSSAFELQTQLLFCERRKYGVKTELDQCLSLTQEVQKMIFSFKENLNK